nr:hypothetical protein [Tanacetum cinerariifolium]
MIVRTWESYNQRLILVFSLATHPQRKHSRFTTDVPDKSSKLFIVDHPTPEVIAPIAEEVAPEPAASTGSPSSTTGDQDAPPPSHSQTTPDTQSLIIPNDVKNNNHDLDVAHMNNDPFFVLPILEVSSYQSSSMDSIHIVVLPNHQPS